MEKKKNNSGLHRHGFINIATRLDVSLTSLRVNQRIVSEPRAQPEYLMAATCTLPCLWPRLRLGIRGSRWQLLALRPSRRIADAV